MTESEIQEALKAREHLGMAHCGPHTIANWAVGIDMQAEMLGSNASKFAELIEYERALLDKVRRHQEWLGESDSGDIWHFWGKAAVAALSAYFERAAGVTP